MTQQTSQTEESSNLQPLEVRNGGRIIRFVGERLAHVSSQRATAPRWTVMELYRTESALYVVHRIGFSLVYHTSDCTLARTNRLQYGHELPGGIPDEAALRSLSPCPSCTPRAGDPVEQLRFERERHWAGVAETAEAAIDLCYRDKDGARSLPWIAANMLELASVRDADLARAYQTQQI